MQTTPLALLPWMAYAVLVGLALTAAAVTMDRTLGPLGLPRRAMWAGALGLSLALPLGVLVWPSATGQDLVTEVSVTSTETSRQTHPPAWGFAPRELLSRPMSATLAAAAGRLPSSPVIPLVVAGLWAVASGLLGTAILRSYAADRRRRKSWPMRRIGGTWVRVSPDAGPAVAGVVRPEIVLPRRLVDGGEALRLAVAHEQAHVRARDPALLAGGLLAVALFPWNPALWLQLLGLRAAVELDCDRRVLRRGHAAATYGELLLREARGGGTDIVTAPGLTHFNTPLERRLAAMKKRSLRMRIPIALGGSLAATGVIVAACDADPPLMPAEDPEIAVSPDAPEPPNPPDLAGSLYVPPEDGAEPLVLVDGAVVPDGASHLEPDHIRSVEVIKGAKAVELYGSRADAGVIYITTVDANGNETSGGAAERPDEPTEGLQSSGSHTAPTIRLPEFEGERVVVEASNFHLAGDSIAVRR